MNLEFLVFLTVSYFLLENVLSLALSKAPEIQVGFFHTLADFSKEVVDGFVFVNVYKHTFGIILNPAGLELKVSIISALYLFIISKHLMSSFNMYRRKTRINHTQLRVIKFFLHLEPLLHFILI